MLLVTDFLREEAKNHARFPEDTHTVSFRTLLEQHTRRAVSIVLEDSVDRRWDGDECDFDDGEYRDCTDVDIVTKVKVLSEAGTALVAFQMKAAARLATQE